MERLARTLLVLSLCLAPGLAPAEVPTDEDGFTSFESVDTGETKSLDEVDTGHTEAFEEVDTGSTHTLDEMDIGHTETLDSVDTGRTHTLDEEDTGRTHTLEEASANEPEWSPPACAGVLVDLGSLPPGEDHEAWSLKLRKTQVHTDQARQRLENADAAYTNAKTHHWESRGGVVSQRDLARREYSSARCALPALLKKAQRAGVPPGVTRPYL